MLDQTIPQNHKKKNRTKIIHTSGTFFKKSQKNSKHIFKICSYIQKNTPNPINAFKITVYNTNTPKTPKAISHQLSQASYLTLACKVMTLFAISDAANVPVPGEETGAPASGRTLMAQGSHADSPHRKQQKKDGSAAMEEDPPVTDSAKFDKLLAMVLDMQHGNTQTNATVKQIQVDMKNVKDTANDAKKAAEAAILATNQLETDMKKTMSAYKKDLDEVKEKVRSPTALAPSSATSAWAAFPASSSAWAAPPCSAEQEEQSRTLAFGNWLAGTDSSTIQDFIDNQLKDHVGDFDQNNDRKHPLAFEDL